eukprot:758587-Hanusia_phi.AAC.4
MQAGERHPTPPPSHSPPPSLNNYTDTPPQLSEAQDSSLNQDAHDRSCLQPAPCPPMECLGGAVVEQDMCKEEVGREDVHMSEPDHHSEDTQKSPASKPEHGVSRREQEPQGHKGAELTESEDEPASNRSRTPSPVITEGRPKRNRVPTQRLRSSELVRSAPRNVKPKTKPTPSKTTAIQRPQVVQRPIAVQTGSTQNACQTVSQSQYSLHHFYSRPAQSAFPQAHVLPTWTYQQPSAKITNETPKTNQLTIAQAFAATPIYLNQPMSQSQTYSGTLNSYSLGQHSSQPSLPSGVQDMQNTANRIYFEHLSSATVHSSMFSQGISNNHFLSPSADKLIQSSLANNNTSATHHISSGLFATPAHPMPQSCQVYSAASTTPNGRESGTTAGALPKPSNETAKLSKSNQSSTSTPHKRDWGLKMVNAVGKIKPPFARTYLFCGKIPQQLAKEDTKSSFNWIIKRWTDKSNRRKIDVEVHECIKANPHPHVVRVIDINESEGILMEYWSEGDLHKQMTMARRTFMPIKQITTFICHTMHGLQHLHGLKIVHCDISPQNIFLRSERDYDREEVLPFSFLNPTLTKCDKQEIGCKALNFIYAIGDFGHSYVEHEHEESRSILTEGMRFVAPEVVLGDFNTMASDIFSTGKILEELLTLAATFKDDMQDEPEEVFNELKTLATSMCTENPGERLNSTEICEKLEQIREHPSLKAAESFSSSSSPSPSDDAAAR